jgi:colanic acid/amylovoran biosynthesis protein
MPVNILLINVHSYRNAGDAAVIDVAMEQLRTYFPGCRITLVMDDPPSYPGNEPTVVSLRCWLQLGRHWQILRIAWLMLVTLIYMSSYKRFGEPRNILGSPELTASLAAMVQADLIICTPGENISSTSRSTNQFLLTFTIFLALITRKPIYFLPQTFGPLKRKWQVWVIRNLLRRARLVLTYEPISFQNLLDWGVPALQCRLVPGLAYTSQDVSTEQGRIWLRSMGIELQNDRLLMGVTVMNWGAQNKGYGGQAVYERAIAATMREFIQQTHGKAILLTQCWGPSGPEDDRIPARRVATSLAGLGDSVILADYPLTAEKLKSILCHMSIFLGTRTHSNIFCLVNNIPGIAIRYDHTTAGFAQMVGVEQWVVDINRISEKELVSKILDLCANRESAIQSLKKKIPELSQQASQIGALLAEDYSGLYQNISDA